MPSLEELRTRLAYIADSDSPLVRIELAPIEAAELLEALPKTPEDREAALEAAGETLDAIHLAMAGASTNIDAARIVRRLLEEAPLVDPSGTSSVERFLRAVRDLDGKAEVRDA